MTESMQAWWSPVGAVWAGSALLAYALAWKPAGWAVARITKRWRTDLWKRELPLGLEGAGRLIGYLERAIVVTLVLYQAFGAIGFLVAAKSLLRFGELSTARDKVQTEYVLVGTLASLALALLLGIGVLEIRALFLRVST